MDALQTNIYITDICNRQCEHCYYPHNSLHMTYQMANEIVDWISRLCKYEQVKEYHAHFLGGEPLLNQGVLFFLIDKLEEHLPESIKGSYYGKYVVFTNGDMLNGALLKEIKNRHMTVMLNPTDLSIEEVGDRMRLIKDICGGVSLAVVADGTNLARLPELAQLAVDLKGHIRINRLYDGGKDPIYVEAFRLAMHGVFDVLEAANTPMWPNFILESTFPTWEGPKNCHACGKWFLAFDPDGSIRSCNADIEARIGHVHKSPTRMSEFKFTHRWSSKGLEECKDCEWANGGLCQGGCPFTRKLTYGTYNKRTPFCSAFKELFPRLQELTKRWKEQHGLYSTI